MSVKQCNRFLLLRRQVGNVGIRLIKGICIIIFVIPYYRLTLHYATSLRKNIVANLNECQDEKLSKNGA